MFTSLLQKLPAEGRIKVSGGITQGHTEPEPELGARRKRFITVQRKGAEYAAKYKNEEEKEFLESHINNLSRTDVTLEASGPTNGGVIDLDELTSIGTLPNLRELNIEEKTQIYDNYKFDSSEPDEQLLPIHKEKDGILNMISVNPVTIITGPTGCGKSTQIPQFILDDHARRRQYCNIVVTQPRRIAAITIAQHVAQQRKWAIGGMVGYKVGLESHASEDTRLLYCTTGVMLEQIIAAKDLNRYTHILLDEVHEREEDMDFVMLIIKKFLRTNSPNVKIVLMSATIDASRFSKYFEQILSNVRSNAPVYDIPSPNKYVVKVYSLDDIQYMMVDTEVKFNEDEPGIPKELFQLVLEMIVGFNRIDESDYKQKRCTEKKGAVLIFLPGLYQIETLYEILSEADSKNPELYGFALCPLHSSITRDEQEKVQKLAPDNKRKVILSTNIAESSITIPDVKFVIDFCLTKHLVADPVTGLSSLQLAWASHTNCIQREGRVGRVQDGRVFRMVPKYFYERNMRKECVPEMQRCPLDIIVLKCKKLMAEVCPLKLISTALDPPDLDNYEKTIHKLKEVGALLTTCRGEESTMDGDITFMGLVMASMPLDIHVTKLILLGHLFGVQEEAVIMGCSMSVRNVFSEAFQQRLQAYNNKLLWADSSESDLVAFMNAYMVWRQQTNTGKFLRTKVSEEAWARRYLLQIKYLREVSKLEDDINRRLTRMKIIERKGGALWNKRQKPLILKLVLAGAFYPNYFSTCSVEKFNGFMREMEAVKELSGQNPFTCVYVQNVPHPAPLYFDYLKQTFSKYGVSQDVKCHYNDTRKVVIEFDASQGLKDDTCTVGDRNLHQNIPGEIAMPVYRAVKMRQLNIPITIRPYRPEDAQNEMKKLSLSSKTSKMSSSNFPPMIKFNEVLTNVMVTHVENATHFYCNLLNYKTEFHKVVDILMRVSKCLRPLNGDPVEDFIYAAPYVDEGGTYYYRAKVVKTWFRCAGFKVARVFFIDYGNYAEVEVQELREMPTDHAQKELEKIPPMAIKCRLPQVGPKMWYGNLYGDWSQAATQFMQKQIMDKNLMAKVYSFVDGVAAIDILIVETDLSDENSWLSNLMVEKGFASSKEEPYLSKVDHTRREEARNNPEKYGSSGESLKVDPLSLPTCNDRKTVNLKGPHSPLEATVRSLVRCSLDKEVRVEWNSVNSVLLDSDPANPCDRLLVAGTVSQSSDGRKLTVNHTTVLPNMPGLSSLVCLIFAPKVELRTDENFSRYTGALCGLGMEEGTSVFCANDIEITFDTEFTNEDFIDINKLRYWINFRFCSVDSDDMSDSKTLDIQDKVKSLTTQLLTRKRLACPIYRQGSPFIWFQIPKRMLYHPFPDTQLNVKNVVYQLMLGIDVNVENDRLNIIRLRAQIESLKNIVLSGGTPRENRCSLCEMDFDYTCQLRQHMDSMRHLLLANWFESRVQALNPPLK